MARPKAKAETAKCTADVLAVARREAVELSERERDLAGECDHALVKDDRAEVDRLELAVADVRKQRERCERRVILLEQKAAEELRAQQETAQAELLERVEAKFKERDKAVNDMCGHMAAMVVSFRRAIAVNGAASTGWPFGPSDGQAAMFGNRLTRAISGELYRLSGSPFSASGAPRDFEFPGASCPDVRDPRPESITPLVDQVRAASDYAVQRMRSRPTLVTPPALTVAPSATVERRKEFAETPMAEPQPPVENEPRALVYAYDVDVMNPTSGEKQTIRVTFSAEDVADAYLDGIGPVGSRGREIAGRLAEKEAPEGFVFDGRREAVRFDLKALTESMGA